MSTLHADLRRTYRRLAPRPVPVPWVDRHPRLGAYASMADVAAAIRDRHQPDRADDVVRVLAALARTDTDATTVLLEALVWHVNAVTGPDTSSEFRDDLLVDLLFVVLESNDLHRVNRLPKRLARRAYARARRRIAAEHVYYERLAQLPEAPLSDDVAEIATDRAHLQAIHQTVQRHIRAGDLPETAWEDYRDGRLAPAMGWRRIQRSRSRTYRARRAVEAVLPHAS